VISVTVSANSHVVYLNAREATHWGTDHGNHYRSNAVTITGAGTYTATIANFSEANLVGLAIMSDGATFIHPTGFMSAAPAPAAFSNLFIKIDSVSINNLNVDCSFEATELVIPYAGPDQGFVNIQLWNGWWEPHNHLGGANVTSVQTSGVPSFALAGGASMNNISVTFTVFDEVPALPHEQGQATVELMAREAVDWSNVWRSNPLVITDDGVYTMTLDITGGYDRLVGLAIMSQNATFDEALGFIGRANPAPPEWFNSARMAVDEVKINGTVVSTTYDDYLIARGHPPTDGYVDVQLWNGFHIPAQRLVGVPTAASSAIEPAPSFMAPGGGAITRIEITFEIYGISGDSSRAVDCVPYCEGAVCGNAVACACPGRDCGFNPCRCGLRGPAAPQGCAGRYPVQLMAREAVDWVTANDNHWRSDTIWLEAGAASRQYTVTMNTPGGYSSFVGLALMTVGANFDYPLNFVGLDPVPADWFEAQLIFDEIRINNTVVGDNRIAMLGEAGNTFNVELVSRGDPPTEGFVDIQLWNGWHDPNQLLNGITRVPTDGNSVSFGLASGEVIESISVTFTVIQLPFCATTPCSCDTREYCRVCGELAPGCRGGGQDEVILTEFFKGDVDGDGVITIGDALEILKYLAGLESTITGPDAALAQNAAMISPEAVEVTISDALEVLKYLAELPSELD
jgi:hypothetical protein